MATINIIVNENGDYKGEIEGEIAGIFVGFHGLVWQLITKAKDGKETEVKDMLHNIVDQAYTQALDDKKNERENSEND